MEQPKISVIVPVYNTEKYVHDAVESIQKQSLRELEILIVNDGSKDNSAVVIGQLAEGDSRIRVFHQENQGGSVARNTALNDATGKYVYFMDSDDLLEEDALQCCYDKCESENLDFVFFDAITFVDEDGLGDTKKKSSSLGLTYSRTEKLVYKVYDGIEIFNIQLTNRQFTPSPCLSVIRRTFIEENKLRFYPGIVHEDQLFTSQLYLHAQRVTFLCRTFFHRRLRKDSIMTSQLNWKNVKGYLTVASELLRFAATHPNPEVKRTIDHLLSQMLDAAVWQAHVLPMRQRVKLFSICLQRYKRYVTIKTLATLLLK